MLPWTTKVGENLNGLNADMEWYKIAVQLLKQVIGHRRTYLILDGNMWPVTLPVLRIEYRKKMIVEQAMQLPDFFTLYPVGHSAAQFHQFSYRSGEWGKPEIPEKGDRFFIKGQMVKYHQVRIQKIPFRRKIGTAFGVKKRLAFFIHFQRED